MRVVKIGVYIISLILLIPLQLLNLRFYIRQDFEKLTEESGWIAERNPLFSLVTALLFLAAVLLVMAVLSAGRAKGRKIAAVLLLLLMVSEAVIGVCWVRMNPLYPSADQQAVWEMGEYLNDPSGEIPYTYTPNYWIKFPRQKFIALFMAALIRLTGIHSYRIYQFMNIAGLILLVPEMYWFGKWTAGGRTAGLATAVLTALFAPLVLYTSYVYPTLLSFTAVMASFDLFLWAVQKMRERAVRKSALAFIVSSFCMAFANLFYSATLIALIAEGVYAVLSGIEDILRERNKHKGQKSHDEMENITSARPIRSSAESGGKSAESDRSRETVLKDFLPLVCILLSFLLFLAGRAATERIFNTRTGMEESAGVPSTAWILMGITSDSEESVAGPGSYDASVEWVYKEFGYDSDATSAYVNEQIGETLQEYLTGKRDLSFFLKKTIHQWCDPWFSSLAMAADQNSAYMLDEEGMAQLDSYLRFLRSPFMRELQGFLLVFQTAVYLGAAVGIVLSIHRTVHGEKGCSLLPVIFFIGGFLFQLFWESKARYCMPYFICLLPVLIYGMKEVGKSLRQRSES